MPRPIDIRAATRKALQGGSSAAARPHYVSHLAADEGFKIIPRKLITPDPNQPRKRFDQERLEEIASSIKEKGILQALTVRPDPVQPGRFLLVIGERRWRAAGLIGLDELPCIIRPDPDHQEVALIENVQRENLTPIEEAEALLKLKTAKAYTDAALAKIIGKSRVSVTETMALNRLPEAIKAQCRLTDKWQKTQLLQVLRAGPPEKVQAAWAGLLAGDTTTARQVKKHANTLKGRRMNYRHTYQPKHRRFAVTVTFARSRADSNDVRAALKEALTNLT